MWKSVQSGKILSTNSKIQRWKLRDEAKERKNSNNKRKTTCFVNYRGVEPKLIEIIKVERFSTLEKLIRVTAWVKRFIHNCRSPKKRGETRRLRHR